MKKTTVLQIVLFSILFSYSGWAQTVVNVDPGIGTLNAAITANGSATYVLKAGQWYGLNATVEVNSEMKIIGEIPGEGQMPAIIQTGSTASGTTFGWMFTVNANLTLRNVFLVNSDLNEGIGSGVFFQTGSARIILDSITVDPIGTNFFLMESAEHVSTYLTNSLLMRQGNTISINDGGIFWNTNGKWDTLYVENNTFVDVGTAWMLFGASPNGDRELFHWINHNSFLFGKAHLYLLYYPDEVYFTNNLCWMQDTYIFKTGGEENWDPGIANKYQGFFEADTLVVDTTTSGGLVTETLPCERKAFIHYNFNYRTQGVWDLIEFDRQSGISSYMKVFMFPESYSDSCRATRMFNDQVAFPYFSAGNNIEDLNQEITANNPNFVDQKIYTLTDSATAWAVVDWQFKRGIAGVPPSSEWPNYFYSIDGNNGNPITWPRFNGAYTNSNLLSSSIEELPLGDLNWFPEKKLLWKEKQGEIMDHIKSLNSSQISLTGVREISNQIPDKYELSQNYPNPFNPATKIDFSIKEQGLVTLKVYNSLGQEVATLVNQVQNAGKYSVNFDASKLASGTYIYKLNIGDVRLVKKLMLLK